MTALKDLLTHAAGDETNLSDADLAAFLHRGRRSARRRRFGVLAATSAATAAAVGVAWAAVPDGPQAEPDVFGGDVQASATPTAGKSPTGKPKKTQPPPTTVVRETYPPAAPTPARAVELVPDGVVRAGTDLVCDLKPKGWRAQAKGSLYFVHPTLHGTGKYYSMSTSLLVRHSIFLAREDGRMELDKYGKTWDELRSLHRKAGNRTAVVSGSSMGPTTEANGMREFHMRMTETKLIVVNNDATSLGWDLPTALRFVGSCHYSR